MPSEQVIVTRSICFHVSYKHDRVELQSSWCSTFSLLVVLFRLFSSRSDVKVCMMMRDRETSFGLVIKYLMYSGMYEKKKEEGLRDFQAIDIPKAELRLSRRIACFLEGESWFGILFDLLSSLPGQEQIFRYRRKGRSARPCRPHRMTWTSR